MRTSPADRLRSFKPNHNFLVCIDSDGCVFDTMGIKQRECFCPWMIKYFRLQQVAQAARECKEFADLFSKTRGANRHTTVKRILTELLPTHPHVRAREFSVPHFPYYFNWLDSPGSLLSNAGLKRAVDHAGSKEERDELQHVLDWSERVNWAVAEIVQSIPPFPKVRESLEGLQGKADVVVVSATPLDALNREWEEHSIAQFTDMIAGQEMGSKQEHIAVLVHHYSLGHVLMIGDAPGDLAAARANNALFFPTIPGREGESWGGFFSEGMDRFLSETYAGTYQNGLIDEFDKALPEQPPWRREQ